MENKQREAKIKAFLEEECGSMLSGFFRELREKRKKQKEREEQE